MLKPGSDSDSVTSSSQAKTTSTSIPWSDLTFSQKWTRTLQSFTKPFLTPILVLSNHAAYNPKLYILATIVLSLALMGVGITTNFTQETDDTIWTPRGSRPVENGKWIDDESGFPKEARNAVIIVHRDGKNLFEDGFALETSRRMFEALDTFRDTDGYQELCAKSDYVHPVNNVTTCQIVGPSTFWNDDTATFLAQATDDASALATLSREVYPLGGKVDRDQIIGFSEFENDILTAGKSIVQVLFLPPEDESLAEDVEKDGIDRLNDLREKWEGQEGGYKCEILAERSFEDEFGRAVTKDLPLMPLVFVLMSLLCIVLFAKRDKVLSRSWLGFGAVVTVLLAIIASFGLLFLIGVPFTSLTPLLPFIIFGVGLDDAFIISGAYARTDASKTPEERIRLTMEDIGGTILLTTITSSLAFALGAVSSIPAVRYLVIYAFPTIMIDFLFQITCFVALIVIDQRRIDQNRRDCCFCCTVRVEESNDETPDRKNEEHFADRLMSRYADFLLKPATKLAVLALFAGMLGFFSWRTSKLSQFFDFTDVIPSDSYIQTWWDSYQDLYEANGVRAGVYFRDVDFGDANVQNDMMSYVEELAAMPYAGKDEPFEFWLRDFQDFVSDNSLGSLTFEEQVAEFLQDPVFYDTYHEDIVLDKNGVMTSSRTLIRLDNVNEEDVLETVDVLELQRSISKNHPANRGKDDWSFFTFSEDYYIWEFYRVSPDELGLTTIIGVVSVSFLALVFIPHWSAILFVGPLVAVLYIDLLGFIELCGVHVNPVMYISTVMSIGLMVDFVMHVTLRYMESTGADRVEKTKDTLQTIGASVFVGGFSTLVGVLPLALSTSEIFYTTFIIFFGLVLLGLLHGLVLLPVLLSIVGPTESIVVADNKKALGREETASDENETRHGEA